MTKTCLRVLIVLAASLALPGRLLAQPSQLSGTGSVEYRLVHKLHTITAGT